MYKKPKVEVIERPKKVVVKNESYLVSGDILLKCPGCNELISYCRVREMMLCTQCGVTLIISEELKEQVELAMRNMCKDEVDPLTAFIRRGMMEDPKKVLEHLKEIVGSVSQISNFKLLNISSPEMDRLRINAYEKMSGIVVQYHAEKKPIEEYDNRLKSGLSEKDREELKTVLENEDFHYAFTSYSSFPDIKDEKFHELRVAYRKTAEELDKYINGE